MSAVTSSVVSAVPTDTAWWDYRDVPMPEDFKAYQSEVQESLKAFFTPLNISIFVIITTLLILRYRATPSAITLDPTRPVTFRTFTPRILLKYNGHKNDLNPEGSVYLAVKGKVYDVTAGRNFYGPGGPYENFAGRDATRGLACQSFDSEMLTVNLDGPLDDCADLKAEEVENLRGWEERFNEKYLIVGQLQPYNMKRSEF